MKKVCLVAHPDDETLWGAGMILRYPGDWTIICATIPRADPIRADTFRRACDVLGARPIVFGGVEPPAGDAIPFLDDICLKDYDFILTHGAAGEYGHIQHKGIARHVARKYGGKKPVAYFGARNGDAQGANVIALTELEAARKLKALKCYDHVLPYDGRHIPKWEALLQRYFTGVDFNVETYDGALP